MSLKVFDQLYWQKHLSLNNIMTQHKHKTFHIHVMMSLKLTGIGLIEIDLYKTFCHQYH